MIYIQIIVVSFCSLVQQSAQEIRYAGPCGIRLKKKKERKRKKKNKTEPKINKKNHCRLCISLYCTTNETCEQVYFEASWFQILIPQCLLINWSDHSLSDAGSDSIIFITRCKCADLKEMNDRIVNT